MAVPDSELHTRASDGGRTPGVPRLWIEGEVMVSRQRHLIYSAAIVMFIQSHVASRETIAVSFELRSLPAHLAIVIGVILTASAIACCAYLARRRSTIQAPGPGLLLALLSFSASLAAFWSSIFKFSFRPLFVCDILFLVALLGDAILTATNSAGFSFAFPRVDRAAFKLTLFVSAFVVSTAVPEVLFRTVTGASPHAVWAYGASDQFVLSPYVMFAEPDVAHGGTLNSQGFQGPEFAAAKGKNEFRVAVVGGSAALAGGNDQSISAYLEKLLTAKWPGKQIRVVNFGRSSYVSMQELILLERYILPLNVDGVVIYDGFNDFWVPYEEEHLGVGYPFLFSNLRERVAAAGHIVNPAPLLLSVTARSTLAEAIQAMALGKVRGSFDLPACVGEYQRNLYQMAALGRIYGAEVCISTQPFIGTKRRLGPKESSYLPPAQLRTVVGYYLKLIESAKEGAALGGARYITTTDVFDDSSEDVFGDVVHLWPNSRNEAVARRLAEHITLTK